MKYRANLFVALLAFFSVFVVGCSQVASGSSIDDDIWMRTDEIEYRDGDWKFEKWNSSLSSLRGYFDSGKYTVPEEGKFSFGRNSNRLVTVNSWEPGIPQYGNFSFGPVENSQGYLVCFDKPDNQKYLLGFVEESYLYDENFESFEEVQKVIRVIEPIEKGNRLYFPLESDLFEDVNDGSYDLKMVQLYYENGSLYKGALKNIVVASTDGKDYPLSFNVNLIVAGSYRGTKDDLSEEELADKILFRLNRAMNPGGITVKKVNVLYAKDHPVVGSEFPDSKDVIFKRTSGGHGLLDSLAHWPGHEGEINFVLGYYIIDEIGGSESVGGFSPLSGHIYNGLEEDQLYFSNDYISMATHALKGEFQHSSDMIASTALHELGHFFGMKHTSDEGGFDDYGDTPECMNYGHNSDSCPDRHYVMFPIGVNDWEYSTFTPQQMDAARYYLTWTPHK